MIEYIAKIIKYVRAHVCTGSFKKRKSSSIPIGKGTKIINHIGAFSASVEAPNKTTEVPIIKACQAANPLLSGKLPMKYDKAVSPIAKRKLK